MIRPTTTFLSLLVATTLGCATPAAAPEPGGFDDRVRDGFFAGFTGDEAALERAMQLTERVLARNPRHAQAMVWHGAGVYFRAGQAFRRGDTAQGFSLFTRGMREMDQAVALEPDDLAVRIPRGAVLLTSTREIDDPAVSRPLLEKGLGDYHRAHDMQKAKLHELGVHPRGELLFGLADGWSRMGDRQKATEFFQSLRASVPGTEYAARADLWLATGSLPAERTTCVGCHVK